MLRSQTQNPRCLTKDNMLYDFIYMKSFSPHYRKVISIAMEGRSVVFRSKGLEEGID